MPPTHAKMPAAMREKCAHGGPMHCTMGCYAEGGKVKGHGRLGVEFNPDLPHREGYPKTAKEQSDNLDAELKRTAEYYRRKPEDKHDRRNLAEGGDVESLDDPMEHEGKEHEGDEHELGKVLAEELMTAMEHKDHKGVMEAIEAIVMNCMSKGGM